MKDLTWIEISRNALLNNISQFRRIVAPQVRLCTCVKANAYGHGLVDSSRIFLDAGADWLSVNALYEARALRRGGIDAPVYIAGYIPLDGISEAIELDCRFVVYNLETVAGAERAAAKLRKKALVHIKAETGTNRQGVPLDRLSAFVLRAQACEHVEIEGLATHFANIEDTTDHRFAELQLMRFRQAAADIEAAGISLPIKHCANSGATILFPQSHYQMVRLGVSSYGMWPSKETQVSYAQARRNNFRLMPAFTWKTKVAQIKTVPAGEYIGYGCTYKTGHTTKLAVLPVGYYDGYDRGVAGGHVLIHGRRAPIRGRICMNIIMVEITDIPEAQIEDEVVLLGRSGDEVISAELFAQWAGTINYEVTTRVNERIARVVVA